MLKLQIEQKEKEIEVIGDATKTTALQMVKEKIMSNGPSVMQRRK